MLLCATRLSCTLTYLVCECTFPPIYNLKILKSHRRKAQWVLYTHRAFTLRKGVLRFPLFTPLNPPQPISRRRASFRAPTVVSSLGGCYSRSLIEYLIATQNSSVSLALALRLWTAAKDLLRRCGQMSVFVPGVSSHSINHRTTFRIQGADRGSL